MGRSLPHPKQKKLFHRYLLSFVVILLVPSFVATLILVSLVRVVQQDVRSSNHAQLTKKQSVLDGRIVEMNTIANSVSTSNRFTPFGVTRNAVGAMEALDEIRSLFGSNSFLYEAVYFIRGSDLLYTASGTFSLRTFVDGVYDYADIDTEEFRTTMNHLAQEEIWPIQRVMVSGSALNVLSLVYPIPVASTNPYGTLLIMIREKSINDLLRDATDSERDHVLVFDGQNRLLGGTSLDTLDIPREGNTTTIGDVTDGYARFGDTTYLVLREVSDATGLTYVSLTPRSDAHERLVAARRTAIVGVGILVVAGSFAIALSMKLTYGAVVRLRTIAERIFGKRVEDMNELESIEYVVRQFAQQSRTLSERAEGEGSRGQRELLFHDLLRGEIKTLAELNERTESCGVSLRFARFAVVILRIPESCASTVDATELISRFEGDKTDELDIFGEEGFFRDRIILVVSTAADDAALLLDHVSVIQRRLAGETGVVPFAGVGELHVGPESVQRSYIQAYAACEYRPFKAGEQIVAFSEFHHLALDLENYPHQQVKEFESAVCRGDVTGVHLAIDTLFGDSNHYERPIFVVQCIVFDLINAMLKSMADFSISMADLDNEVASLLSSIGLRSTEDVASLLDTIGASVCAEIDVRKESHNVILVRRIADHLRESWCDPNLSIRALADDLGVSYSYISRYFRDQTGSTLLQEINRRRIDAAKELLATSNVTVAEIVRRIGYRDVTSFIRKFKSLVGATPGKYRRIHFAPENTVNAS